MKQLNYLFRKSLRSILLKLTYSTSVVSSVGVSVGALICAITLCHLLLLSPLPYDKPDQLYVVTNEFVDANNKIKGEAYTYPGVLLLQDEQSTFSESAPIYYSEDVISSESSQPTLYSSYTDGNWFSLFDVNMHLGRVFDEREARHTFNHSAIISYDTWQQEFQADTNVIGRKIDANGRTFEIVGVTSNVFQEPQLLEKGRATEVWFPWDFNPASEGRRQSWSSINGSIFWIGRIAEQYNAVQAEEVLTSLINERWQKEVSDKKFFSGWNINAKLTEMKDFITGDSSVLALLLLAGVTGLVVITCVNIACLILSRAAEQQKTMAIQASVGAKRANLLLDKLVEIGMLMTAAFVIAVLISLVGFHLLRLEMHNVLPRVSELGLNYITLLSALLVCVFLSFLFSWLSIGGLKMDGLVKLLQTGSKGAGMQLSRQKQNILITGQVAVASFLIFCNIALFIDSKKIIDTDIGFNVENVARIYLDKTTSEKLSDEEIVATMDSVKRELLALPEVSAISQSGSPLAKFSKMALTLESSDESFTPLRKEIDHEYFSMVEQPLVQGRDFAEQDIRSGTRVMIINDVLAKQLGGDPINQRLSAGGDVPYSIIGVVKSISLPNAPGNVPRVYTPNKQSASYFLVKQSTSQPLSREAVVSRVSSISSHFVLSELSQLKETYNLTLFTQITTLTISATLTILVVILAGLGIYGIVNNTIQQRKFELGTRVAIGAKKHQIITLILRNNLVPIMLGIALQITVLACLYFFMEEQVAMFINTQLIAIFAVTIAIIVAIAWAACYLPLRSMFNRPPSYLLRSE